MGFSADNLKSTSWQHGRITAATAVETALATTIAGPNPPAQFRSVEGFRGAVIRFYSNGANNETATFSLYEINEDPSHGWSAQRLIGTNDSTGINITLGTSAAVSTTIADDPAMTGAKLWADTITTTSSSYGSAVLTMVGGNIAAYSPADNTIAQLNISDFGGCQGIALVCTTYGLTATSAIMPIIRLIV